MKPVTTVFAVYRLTKLADGTYEKAEKPFLETTAAGIAKSCLDGSVNPMKWIASDGTSNDNVARLEGAALRKAAPVVKRPLRKLRRNYQNGMM